MEHIEPISGIHYWTAHNTAPTTIVLIHGFTGSHEGFQYIEPLLGDFRLIMPDLPGFGVSPIPSKNDWSIDRLAASLNTFVKNLKLTQPPILLGHSMGGLVAASMIKQGSPLYDQRVVLIAPVPAPVTPFESRTIGARLDEFQYFFGNSVPKIGPAVVKSTLLSLIITQLLLTTRDKALRTAIRRHHLDNLKYLATPEHMRYYETMQKDTNRRGAIDYSASLKKKDCLIIAGTRDAATPLPLQRQLAQASHAKLFTIDGVNHLSHYERPNEIARAINHFLSTPMKG